MSNFKNTVLPAIFTKYYREVSKVEQDILRSLTDVFASIESILNSGIKFQDNVDCKLKSVASHGTPGTEFSLAHTLGKVPVGYIVYGQSAAGSIFDGTTANTATTIYFKSDVATVTFKLIVF